MAFADIIGDGSDLAGTWPTSGAATGTRLAGAASTSGLYDVEFGGMTITHKPWGASGAADERPSLFGTPVAANGYLEFAEGQALGLGAFISAWADYSGNIATGFYHEFFLQFATTASFILNETPTASGGEPDDNTAYYLMAPGTAGWYHHFTHVNRNGRFGFLMRPWGVNAPFDVAVHARLFGQDGVGGITTPSDPMFPANKWMRFGLYLKYAAAGEVSMFLQGRRVGQITGDFSTAAAGFTGFDFAFPGAISNMPTGWKLRIAPPFYNRTAIPTLASDYSNVKSWHHRVKTWPVRSLGTAALGHSFSVSGTATDTGTDYVAASAGHTRRRRRVLTGAAATTYVITSTEKVYNGTTDPTPYGAAGYTTILDKMVLCADPNGIGGRTTYLFQIRNSGNSDDLVRIAISADGTVTDELNSSAVLFSGLSDQARHAFGVKLSVNGVAKLVHYDLTDIDHTATEITTATITSFPSWTSTTAIGIVIRTLTLGDGLIGVGTKGEIDGIDVYRTITHPIIDSFMAGGEGTVTPELVSPANVCDFFDTGTEAQSVPGGYSPHLYGQTALSCAFGPILARRGGKLTQFVANVLPNLAGLVGDQMMLMMGLYNDTHAGETSATMISTWNSLKSGLIAKGITPWFVPAYNITGEIDYLPYNASCVANTGGGLLSDVMSHSSGTTLSDGTTVVKSDTVHPDGATSVAISKLIGSNRITGSTQGGITIGGGASITNGGSSGVRGIRSIRSRNTR